jgi:hypothetical protein
MIIVSARLRSALVMASLDMFHNKTTFLFYLLSLSVGANFTILCYLPIMCLNEVQFAFRMSSSLLGSFFFSESFQPIHQSFEVLQTAGSCRTNFFCTCISLSLK